MGELFGHPFFWDAPTQDFKCFVNPFPFIFQME